MSDFKQEMTDKGIDVIFLVGNHDVPYLTQQYEYYSCKQVNCLNKIYNLLNELQPQIAFKVTDNVIASHAGYIGEVDMKECHFEPWSIDFIDEYEDLQNGVGKSRGGVYTYGSVLWADLTEVTILSFLDQIQVVGHTPVKKINTTKNVIGVDTFSITSDYDEIDDGSLLVYKDNEFKVIKNETWQTPETRLERLIYFL